MTRIVRRTALKYFLSGELHPVLQRIYSHRNITSNAELDYALKGMLSLDLLGGIHEAVALLYDALTKQQSVIIVGDFDADGATSTALMMKALTAMGLTQLDYRVPNRFEYGYGLTPEIVENILDDNPDLIITVDNGISSVDGVARAQEAGIKVLITDHHLPPEILPAANAIVNPNMPGDSFPSKNLAGVGVAFYIMAALRAHLRKNAWFEKQGISEPNLANLLDLVALGTVADVVALDHNNRTLVSQGISRIRAGKCSAGITELLKIAKRSPHLLVASDLGFAVGPRLNAAGRLDDMSVGIECLLSENTTKAKEYARKLDELNSQRRAVEADMQSDALELLSSLTLEEEKLPWGLSLYDQHWHEGVIGILASRIKERFHRPVICFAPASSETGTLKGSARSIKGLHIRDAIDAVASRSPGLIRKFGGHAMAAGLSLAVDDLNAFSNAFDEQVKRCLNKDELEDKLLSDGELNASEINMTVAEHLRNAGPWGQSFPEPVFDGEFELIEKRIVGGSHLKLQVRHPADQKIIDVIAFNITDDAWPESVKSLRMAYRLDINEFRGQRTVQLNAESIEPISV